MHPIIPLLLVVLIAFIVFYICVTRINYTDIPVRPGLQYTLNNKIYTVPGLSFQGTAYLLKESFRNDQLELLDTAVRLFRNLGIPLWLSGGTLLGFCRHNTFVPWDDDIDSHTLFMWARFLFSLVFQQECRNVGLEAVRIKWSKFKLVSRISAGVRIRKIGTVMPCMDIFFVHRGRTHTSKIHSWTPRNITTDIYETWENDDIFPIQRHTMCGVEVSVPNKPVAVISTQYGKNAMEHMYLTPVEMSHALPFYIESLWE
jgi:hypothetical protein